MAVLLEALIQAVAGQKSALESGQATRAAVVLAPFLILSVVYFVSR
jgi:hypothetical protein